MDKDPSYKIKGKFTLRIIYFTEIEEKTRRAIAQIINENSL
jgi:hypothetical protein